MPKYSIDIHNIENGDIRVTASGTVNGVNVPAVIMVEEVMARLDIDREAAMRHIVGRTDKVRKLLAEAMVDSLEGRGKAPVHAGMITVNRD